MKRDQRALLDGRTADEVDGRKRRRTEVEEGGDARLARAQEASRARQQKMKQWLDKWFTLNAEVATEFEITAPAPNPLGTTLRPRARTILTPLLLLLPPRLLRLLEEPQLIQHISVGIPRVLNAFAPFYLLKQWSKSLRQSRTPCSAVPLGRARK
jgi:hypothetical protein